MLFQDLVDRNVSVVFLRVLLFTYRYQSCDVRWNGKYSFRFPVSNGVKQGSVASPLLWACYCEKLFLQIRRMKIGATIAGVFYGILIYADDIFLLCPSRDGLQAMVSECERFASERNLLFSTNPVARKSKTKSIIFSKVASERENVAPIMLNGLPLPWVTSMLHLGNTLQEDNSMSMDCAIKRGQFIGKFHSLSQEFYYLSPDVKTKLLLLNGTCFYASSLWNLFSAQVERLYTSWNQAIRQIFSVPRTTHRFFIEPLSDCHHPKTMLCARMVKFWQTLTTCRKPAVRILAGICKMNTKTVFGSNLINIARECNCKVTDLTPSLVKQNLRYAAAPEQDQYKISFVKELVMIKSQDMMVDNFSNQELFDIIDYLCTS